MEDKIMFRAAFELNKGATIYFYITRNNNWRTNDHLWKYGISFDKKELSYDDDNKMYIVEKDMFLLEEFTALLVRELRKSIVTDYSGYVERNGQFFANCYLTNEMAELFTKYFMIKDCRLVTSHMWSAKEMVFYAQSSNHTLFTTKLSADPLEIIVNEYRNYIHPVFIDDFKYNNIKDVIGNMFVGSTRMTESFLRELAHMIDYDEMPNSTIEYNGFRMSELYDAMRNRDDVDYLLLYKFGEMLVGHRRTDLRRLERLAKRDYPELLPLIARRKARELIDVSAHPFKDLLTSMSDFKKICDSHLDWTKLIAERLDEW